MQNIYKMTLESYGPMGAGRQEEYLYIKMNWAGGITKYIGIAGVCKRYTKR
jgi:hypothetical protein